MFRKKGQVTSRFAVIFLSLTVALTGAVWFYLAPSFQVYRSEVRVLLIPRNENITAQIDLIMENLLILLHQKENIEISRQGKSSILAFASFDLSAEKSQALARKSALDLISIGSKYYNIKTELDFRILDEIETAPLVKDWPKLLLVSLGLGATLSLFLSYILRELGGKIIRFLVAKWKQIATLGVGWTVDQGMNLAFDFLLYPLVIGLWGLKLGGGIMIIISLILSIGQILFYDWAKKDWLGIEALKSIRDEDQKTRIGRIVSWLMKKGDPAALIGLSIFYSEPVAITLYMRRGAYQFNGFSKRDWIVFACSVIISNVSWALAVWGGLEALQAIF